MYERQLKAFICAVQCGSFSKAADKLYNTPASVMNQINSLEERIGARLLERSNHGISLTPAGYLFYEDALNILRLFDQAAARAREADKEEAHTIRIGSSLLYPCKILMDLWHKMDDAKAKFQIEIVPFEDNRTHILAALSGLGKNIDILAGACSSKSWLSRCNIYPLGKYKVCCAVPRSHPLAQKRILNIEDLYGEQLMMVKQGDTPILDRLREALKKNHPQITIIDAPYFYDAEVFNKSLESGCILLSLDAWSDVHPGLITLPVSWDYAVEYGLLYSRQPSRSVLLFLDAIKQSRRPA